jgi:hypothetical protein
MAQPKIDQAHKAVMEHAAKHRALLAKISAKSTPAKDKDALWAQVKRESSAMEKAIKDGDSAREEAAPYKATVDELRPQFIYGFPVSLQIPTNPVRTKVVTLRVGSGTALTLSKYNPPKDPKDPKAIPPTEAGLAELVNDSESKNTINHELTRRILTAKKNLNAALVKSSASPEDWKFYEKEINKSLTTCGAVPAKTVHEAAQAQIPVAVANADKSPQPKASRLITAEGSGGITVPAE